MSLVDYSDQPDPEPGPADEIGCGLPAAMICGAACVILIASVVVLWHFVLGPLISLLFARV